VFDPDDPRVDIEMTAAQRPSNSTGDRLMVGLAVIALLGGALIGIGKLLPQHEEASRPSPTPSAPEATPTLKPTATPVPTETPLRTYTVDGDLPPSSSPRLPEGGFYGLIRAEKLIRVRATPNSGDTVIGRLQPGEAAWVSEDPNLVLSGNWLRVETPFGGWIRDDPKSLHRYLPKAKERSSSIESIVAGPAGQFLAIGSDPDGTHFVAQSAGGNDWERLDAPELLDGVGDVEVAYGPAGWIAMVTKDADVLQGHWLFQSSDGRDWEPLGALRLPASAGRGGQRLVGSSLGYVLLTVDYVLAERDRTILYSADGQVWSERPLPIAPGDIVASALGFYAYQSPGAGRRAAFSPDGWNWSEANTRDFAQLVGVVAAPDRMVALDRVGFTVHTWTARVEDGSLVWRRELVSEAAFDGAAVGWVGGGDIPLAMGWTLGADQVVWWSNDGDGWHRHSLPAGFGRSAFQGASSGDQVELMSYGSSPLLYRPIFWGGALGGDLAPEASPIVPQGAITAADCRGYQRDIMEMLTSSSAVLAHCFGHDQLVIRAFVTPCEGCEYDPGPIVNQPAWLAQPSSSNLIHLGAVEDPNYSYLDATLHPGLAQNAAWEGRWVRVVGHYNDPAADRCRLAGGSEEAFYTMRSSVVADCRSRFVVTSVTIEE
jgi:hypothetical protein